MRKIASFVVVVVAAAFAFGTAFAADAPSGPISIKEFQKSKPPVTFDHSKHASVKCNVCHHKSDAQGTNAEKCSKCHTAKTEGKKLEAKEAYHKVCRGCHEKEKKGPTKCNDCHKK